MDNTVSKGTPGIDTSIPATQKLLDLGGRLFARPVFWGRYFKAPNSTPAHAPAIYQPAKENVFLHSEGIKVLPLAQQTNHVGSQDPNLATADAKANCAAIIKAFGADYVASQGNEFLVFLDVEGSGASQLSSTYWTAWSEALAAESLAESGGRFTFNPCVYGREDDQHSWNSLKSACTAGAKCGGVWIFRMRATSCRNGFVDWDDAFVKPSLELPCDILLWQFAIDCPNGDGVDADQTNPNLASPGVVLDRLILPPNHA